MFSRRFPADKKPRNMGGSGVLELYLRVFQQEYKRNYGSYYNIFVKGPAPRVDAEGDRVSECKCGFRGLYRGLV